MATIGRSPDTTKNELAAGESGGQQVQGAQREALGLGEAAQQRQFQAFEGADKLRAQQTQHREALAEETRHNKMGEAIHSDEQDIQMADKGLQQQGQSRADALRAEMDRGRQQTQMDKPLEIQGPDRATKVSQTPERAANDQARRASDEMNARARFNNSVRLMEQARIKGDTEAAKEAGKTANSYIQSSHDLLTSFKSGRASEAEWTSVQGLASKFGDAHPDPQLQADITNKQFTPRVADFLRANVDHWALSFIAGTGEMPNGHLVDLASPMMGALTQSAEKTAAYLRQADAITNGAFSAGMKIDSEAEKNRIVRKLAAQQLLKVGEMGGTGQQQQPQQGAADQMPIPSQGGPSARPQPSGAIENPGGGPPLLPDRATTLRAAERARAGSGGAGPGAGAAGARDDIDRRKEYGFGGQR